MRSLLAQERDRVALSLVVGRFLSLALVMQLVRDHGEAELANSWMAAVRLRNSPAHPDGTLADGVQVFVAAFIATPDPGYDRYLASRPGAAQGNFYRLPYGPQIAYAHEPLT